MPPCSRASWPTRSVPTRPARFALLAGCWCSTVFDGRLAVLAGTHRIQRVPANDKQGRRHSSTITVVALADEVFQDTVRLDRRDVRIDTFRATGPGGQHRNKTDSGVRLTHLPTGTVVTATEDRSQHANRQVAWTRLSTALATAEQSAAHSAANGVRSAQFGGQRSWSWTAWRDEVRCGPVRARMSAVLRGDFGPILSEAISPTR